MFSQVKKNRARYPRRGAGQGADIALGAGVAVLRHSHGRITSAVCTGADGSHEIPAGHVIASMPVTHLIQRLYPRPPEAVLQAARSLSYRSLITVNLLLRRPAALPDQWIYLQSPEVRAGRLHVSSNFSPDLVPDPSLGSVTLEYFCSTAEPLAGAADSTLMELAKADLEKAGLANLHCVGRFGQFRYNNMNHAMLTGGVFYPIYEATGPAGLQLPRCRIRPVRTGPGQKRFNYRLGKAVRRMLLDWLKFWGSWE